MGPDRASCGKVLISPPGWASDRPPSKRAILGAKTQKRANGRISGSIPEEDIKGFVALLQKQTSWDDCFSYKQIFFF
jgi:hypothetical protein